MRILAMFIFAAGGLGWGQTPVAPVVLPAYVLIPPDADRVRVQAGGPAFTDPQGRIFDTEGNLNGSGAALLGLPWDNGAAYPQPYRYMRFGATFSYTFSVVPGEVYFLRFHFIETTVTAPKQRVFDVLIDGVRVLPNVDIVAAAGFAKPYTLTATVDALTSGTMTVTFTSTVRTAVVSAIEVIPDFSSNSARVPILTLQSQAAPAK